MKTHQEAKEEVEGNIDKAVEALIDRLEAERDKIIYIE